MAMRVLLCLATLSLGACAMQPKELSYQTDEPVPQNVNVELPSAPPEPPAAPQDVVAQIVPAPQPEIEQRSNCQIGFEEIMAEANRKIVAQRHM